MRNITISLLACAALICVIAGRANAEQLVGLTTANTLITFDSTSPNVVTSNVAVDGLLGGEALLGIDRRPTVGPNNGQLYGITNFGNIYIINPLTGATLLQNTASVTPVGSSFGVDFNPFADRLRVTSSGNQNLRINVDTGDTNEDGDLNPGDPTVVASAYTNNFGRAPSTTLFNIDAGTDQLFRQVPPNMGTQVLVGNLGINVENLIGFDISGISGTAFAAFIGPGASFSTLYQINLTGPNAGLATSLGQIGTGSGFVLNGLAAQVGTPVPEPASMILLGTGLMGVGAAVKKRRAAKKQV